MSLTSGRPAHSAAHTTRSLSTCLQVKVYPQTHSCVKDFSLFTHCRSLKAVKQATGTKRILDIVLFVLSLSSTMSYVTLSRVLLPIVGVCVCVCVFLQWVLEACILKGPCMNTEKVQQCMVTHAVASKCLTKCHTHVSKMRLQVSGLLLVIQTQPLSYCLHP